MDAQQFLAEFGHIANAPGGVGRLRELVYQFAVTGRLTAQREEDGNADVVLNNVARTRQHLINDKKFKRSPKLESAPLTSPAISIPPSWRWSRLLDLGEINPRNQVEEDAETVVMATFVPMAAVSELHSIPIAGEVRPWAEISKGYTHFANGDVLLAKITPCFENGKSTVVKGLEYNIGSGSTEFHVFRPISEDVNPAYVYLFVRSPLFRAKGEASMTGTAGQKRLPTDYFALCAMPLPPTEEQSRIVAKVDELMALCDQLEAQQQKRRTLQNNLRQATLQAVAASQSPHELQESWQRLQANFGQLFSAPEDVADLRNLILDVAMHGYIVEQDAQEGSAQELLQQIESIKEHESKKRKIKLQKSLPDIGADEIPFNIPRNWEWIRLGKIAELINGDRGKNYPNKDEYVSKGIAWINTGHIEPNGTLTKTGMNYITREKFESLRSGKIEPDDLVYCLRGATFGKTAFVTPYEEGAIASSLMIIRPLTKLLNKYFYYYLISPLGRSQILRFDNGTAQPNLSANSVGMFAYPLPPLAEQVRIVEKIKQLMQVCDELELKLKRVKEVAEQLATASVSTLTGIAIEQEEEPMKAPQTENEVFA